MKTFNAAKEVKNSNFWNVVGRHEWAPGAIDIAGKTFNQGSGGVTSEAIVKVYAAIVRSYSLEERQA